MCELRDVKQRSFDAVCRDFVQNHNIEKLAESVGISGTMLRNKLNPEQPHKLTPVDLAILCNASGDYTIVNTLLGDLGVVVAAVPKEEQAKTFVERVLMNSALAGELSRDAITLCNAERLYRSDKRKTIARAQSALTNLVSIISDLENRTTGATPLISMGMDLLASGGPIPGLA